MNACLQPAFIAFLLLAVGAADAAQPPQPGKAASDACEAAVSETVRRIRGRDAAEVQFVGSQRALSPTLGDETGVKGEGKYRGAAGGAVPFTYSCTYNAQTGTTDGVVFRETGVARTTAEAPWQPDLTHLSPEACEAAAAAALKDKYPRVSRIAFGSDSRRLKPVAKERTSLEGQGGIERAPGMSSVPFSYRCEIETASGKVVSVQTSE
jgi:hypothetical protein